MQLNPYAEFLNDQDPIPVLTSTADHLRAFTSELSATQINVPPAPGKWSICQIVSHLADCELVFSVRLRQTLSEKHLILQPFDQEVWGKRYAAYHLEPALTLFRAARTWNLLFLTTVTQDDRHHPVTHPERGTMTLWTIVETMAGHDINHLEQIRRLTSATQGDIR